MVRKTRYQTEPSATKNRAPGRRRPLSAIAKAPEPAALPAPPVSDPHSAEMRRRVEEAAYFRALNRGFEGGDPEDDWYAAEREIVRADGWE